MTTSRSPGSPPIIELMPYYRILSAQSRSAPGTFAKDRSEAKDLLIEPGKGFGDGRHETTQLCLLAMGYLLRSQLTAKTMLDFGSGNGILAIAGARSGARVEAVEIDLGAIEEAKVNAALNGVSHLLDFRTELQTPCAKRDLVVANILKQILIDFAPHLSDRLSPSGYLILSGLTATDVPSILARYTPLLPEHQPSLYERTDWRAVVFSPNPHWRRTSA